MIWNTSGKRSSTYCGHDRDLGAFCDRRSQPFQISNIFVAQENIDVFADFSLFGRNPIPKTGILFPQRQQNIAKRALSRIDFDLAPSISVNPQRAGNMDSDCHLLADLPNPDTHYGGQTFENFLPAFAFID